MGSNSLFTIGGHSLYHDILSLLPFEKMKKNIDLSIQLLEYNLNQPIAHYSYPEGQPNHYNADVIHILKKKKIKCCPSAISGINKISEDLFHMKRIMVGFNGAEFPYNQFQ